VLILTLTVLILLVDGAWAEAPINNYFGVATSSRDNEAWPFKLTLIGPDANGSITGQIEWTSLDSIHQIVGSKTTTGITFMETAYIKKGRAFLNCKYYLNSDGNSFKGTWDSCGEGNYGNITIYHSSTPINNYSGVATSGRDNEAWPFKLALIGPDVNGSITGQIEWTSLDSIHQIVGSKTTTGITFMETAYIKKGRAFLNCKYYLNSDGNSFKGTWDNCGEGNYGDITVNPL
jgi:hypothetical protein